MKLMNEVNSYDGHPEPVWLLNCKFDEEKDARDVSDVFSSILNEITRANKQKIITNAFISFKDSLVLIYNPYLILVQMFTFYWSRFI